MAVRRSQNWVNQQRVDTPHLRSIESAIRNDFDELMKSYILGEDTSYVLRGFELNMTGAVGSSANGLQLIVEEGSIFHGKSNVAGTFFVVPSGTPNETLNSTVNTKVDGSFTPSSLNYIGLEYKREVDDSTTSQIYLWNPTNKNEITKTLPLAETLDYEIIITSSSFASNVLPIAIVETDASNNVLSVTDRRPMLFRLGTAGTATPDPFYVYPWNNHSEGRTENFWKSTSSISPFRGGDKQILNEKEWYDAIMSSILEIKGTPFWYSTNAGGSIIKLRLDLANSAVSGAGSITHDASTPGKLNWSSAIYMNLVGSRLSYKINANASSSDIVMSDNQVGYVNLVRGIDITPNIIFTNGSPTVSSVGSVPWTTDLQSGDYVKVAAVDDTYYYEIQSVDSPSQVTLVDNYADVSTGSAGIQAQYAFGVYESNPAPSTNRHIYVADRKDVPFSEDTYWLFLRADNGASIPKVYVRFMGMELEQGESREINDNTSTAVLNYSGMANESDSTPDYTNAIATGVAEITTFTFPAAASITDGQYFTINSALDLNEYYVWFNKDGGGSDPIPAGKIAIPVAISTGDTNLQVAAAAHAAINALGAFNSVDNLDGTVTVTNASIGSTTDAANVNVGAGFSVNVDTQGAGEYTHYVIDDENLTKGIKRLDEQVFDNELAISAAAAASIQDNNLKLIKGGTFSWVESTDTLSFSSDAYIQIPGLPEVRNTIVAASNTDLDADGKVLYVSINRTTGPVANLTIQSGAIDSLSLSDDDFIIARRVGNAVIIGTNSTLLTDRESKELLDDEVYKYHGQLKLRPHLTNVNRALVSSSDISLVEGTVLSQEIKSLLMSFSGAEIDFSTGVVYEDDGITGLGIDFTPAVIPVGEYHWYSITLVAGTVNANNTIGAQLVILPATASNAVKDTAPRAAFASGTKLGQIAIYNNGGTITVVQSNIHQMGVGGGGTGEGDANELLERLKNQHDQSPFEFMLPNIISQDEDSKVDPTSTATYDIANGLYNFASIGDSFISTNMLDALFLAEGRDVGEIELSLFWDFDTLDDSATYSISRDGGNEYQTLDMTRVVGTDNYVGYHKFEDEAANQTLYSNVTGSDTSNDFNNGTRTQLSQKFVIASGVTDVIKELDLEMTKTGSPLGAVRLRIVRDDTGLPSTDLLDVISESQPKDLSSISTGTVNFEIGAVLPEGTYHLVIVPDAVYNSSYVNGVTELAWNADVAGAGEASQFNGTIWSAIATTDFRYVLKGRTLDLRIRIVAGNNDVNLAGYGIFYDYQDGLVTGEFNREVFTFDGIVDNDNEFTLNNFYPDPDKLKVYWVGTGKVFVYRDFLLDGAKIIFPANTFNVAGNQELVFEQPLGGGYDNSDQNASLLAANFLGSSNATIDRSSPGRGIILRRPDGTLREITIDNSDNIVIKAV